MRKYKRCTFSCGIWKNTAHVQGIRCSPEGSHDECCIFQYRTQMNTVCISCGATLHLKQRCGFIIFFQFNLCIDDYKILICLYGHYTLLCTHMAATFCVYPWLWAYYVYFVYYILQSLAGYLYSIRLKYVNKSLDLKWQQLFV